MKVATVVGARPEFIQASLLSRAIRGRHTEILVHTGQHYDQDMSDTFFRELDLPPPDENLGVGAGLHGEQTGRILARMEEVLLRHQPDWVVAFGDTNSTVGGALAAAKLHIPVAHVEAGLRSFDRRMPEEVNRVIADHVSDLLLAPTARAVENLRNEGLTAGVVRVGDVRVDVLSQALSRARPRLEALRQRLGLGAGEAFALSTIHRASNTDDPGRLRAVLAALSRVPWPVVLPVHPRLKMCMEASGLTFSARVRPLPPIGFLDTVALLDGCNLVVTDSGGLQKEAYMLGRATITLRDTTEWVETVEAGYNRLAEPDEAAFAAALHAARTIPDAHPDFYGAPGVCERIVDCLERYDRGAKR